MELLKKKRYNIAIEEALPHCFTIIANAMKAGLPLIQSLQIASREAHPPLAKELQEILEKVSLGRSLDEALLLSEGRLKIPDFSLMVHSIVTLRQIGGNFVVHFENLARILRERERVSAKIRLLTTQGTTQATILGLMPFGLSLILYFLSPEFVSPLFETPLGWLTIFLVLILDGIGFLWINQLSKIEI